MRLGHTSKSTVRNMLSSHTISGMKLKCRSSTDDTCSECQHGKQIRESFKGHFKSGVPTGEVIHSDLCGPMAVSSSVGARYSVNFIAQGSHFTTAVVSSRKYGVLTEFHMFRTFFEG